MAVYDLQEQEQISQIKAWWEQNGKLVIALLIIASLVVIGLNAWRWHTNKQGAEASLIYFAVEQAAARDNPQEAREAAGRLIADYGSTTYAQLAALLSASVQFNHKELDNAEAQLNWAADKGANPFLKEIARLRLATVLLQKGAYDDALARLEPLPSSVNLARYQDLRGDILATQGKNDEARAAYQSALDALSVGEAALQGAFPEVVRMKLESLGA